MSKPTVVPKIRNNGLILWFSVISRLCFLFVALSTFALGETSPADPWKTAFAQDAAKMFAAAKGVTAPEGADAVVLLDDLRYSIDAAGRLTATTRRVYRVLTNDGVEDWSSLERDYEPWHERKPELRARVITAEGAVHWFDAKTITDAPALQFDSSIFSDRRTLRAPLPAVGPGAVVEYEITTKETAPVLEAGSVQRIDVWDSVKIQRLYLTVDAAPGIPLRASSQRIPKETIRRSESGGAVHIECDWGPIEARKDWEYSLPFDVANHPVFEFSTGNSWQAIAARYSAIVDGRIGTAKLHGLGDAPKPDESPKAIAARLMAAVHKQVRYTGLELGDAAVVPGTPADVLARKYGDCKDKATLMVAALRAAGVKAHVALLSSGYGLDVNPTLPGFGLFNHAIVYVEGPEPLWIDATAQYTRVGDLPAGDQGRLALIASATTTALVRTPESRSADNRAVHTVEMRLPDYGRAEISETVESFGTKETELRGRFGGTDQAKVKETLEPQVKQIYLTDRLSSFTTTQGEDFSQPYSIVVNVNSGGRGVTEEDDAVAGLFTNSLFVELPFTLASLGEDSGSDDKKAREHDFVLSAPYQMEYRYRVYYPSFLKPKPLPQEEHVAMGPATFSSSYRLDPAGYVEAIFRFDTGTRRFTPAEYKEFRAGLRKVWHEKPEVVFFASATSEAIALGKAGDAVRIARGYAAGAPKSAAAQARLARVLIASGAGESAVAAAKKAVELDPKSTQAWQALGWAYQHDSFGRRFRGNWNRAEAEKAYRQAIEVTPEKLVPQTDLAILLEHNPSGERYAQGSRLEDAIATYRAALTKGPNDGVQQNLIIALLYGQQLKEAAAELKKMGAVANKPLLSMVTTALTGGADRAILDAQNEIPDPQARALAFVNAGATLIQLRQYAPGLELFKAARRISDLAEIENRLKFASRIKRFDEVQYPADDPRYPVQRVFYEVFSGRIDEARLRPLMSRLDTTGPEAYSQAAKSIRRPMAAVRGILRNAGVTGEGIADLAMSMLELEKTGNDKLGYRITGGTPGNTIPAAYVVKENGQYRWLGTADSLENVGKLVLELVRANDLEAARNWLDLVIEGKFAGSAGNITSVVLNAGPEGDDPPAAKYLWTGLTTKGKTAAAIRLTAASLIGTYSSSEEAIRILKQSRLSATTVLDRGNLDLALCQAYAKAGKWIDLLAKAKDLSASYPVASQRFRYVVKARTGLKQWAELEQDARAELKASPRNEKALRAAALATLQAGKPERAGEYIDQIGRLEFRGKEEHALQAWYAILTGKVTDKLIEDVEGDRTVNNVDSAPKYLVGLLQIQAGKADEARRSLISGLELDDWDLLDARPWVLQAKVQEKFGNADAAAAAYAEAKKHAGDGDDAAWALKLIPRATKP